MPALPDGRIPGAQFRLFEAQSLIDAFSPPWPVQCRPGQRRWLTTSTATDAQRQYREFRAGFINLRNLDYQSTLSNVLFSTKSRDMKLSSESSLISSQRAGSLEAMVPVTVER